MKKIYKVTVYASMKYTYTVEAKDEDDAQEKAYEQCVDEEAPQGVDDINVEDITTQILQKQEEIHG